MKLIIFLSLFTIIGCTNGHSHSKKKFLKEGSHHKNLGKSTGHFQANVQITSDANEAIELTASVLLLRDAEEAQAEWKLPKNVKIIEGNLVQTLNFDDPGDSKSKILLDKNSLKPNDQIFFFVYKVQNGKKVGTSHSFIYQSEDTFKASGVQQKSKKDRKAPKYFE